MFEVRRKIAGKQWKDFPVLGLINEPGEMNSFCKERGLKVFDIRILGIRETYYTSSDFTFTIDQFIETEVTERGNYLLEEVKKWIKKYNINTYDSLVWVSREKWIANRYNLSADEWECAEEIPEYEMDVHEISSERGFIIPESDDGDSGYIFVWREKKRKNVTDKTIWGYRPRMFTKKEALEICWVGDPAKFLKYPSGCDFLKVYWHPDFQAFLHLNIPFYIFKRGDYYNAEPLIPAGQWIHRLMLVAKRNEMGFI